MGTTNAAWKRWIIGLASFIVSGVLIAWLLVRADIRQLGAVILGMEWKWLAVCAVATVCMSLCASCRWLGVLRAQEDVNVGFLFAVRAQLFANVLNSFLPSKSGEMVKAVFLRRHGGLSMGIGTVLLERAVDFCVLGLLGIFGYFVSGALWGLITGIILILGIIVGAACVLVLPLDRLPLSKRWVGAADDVTRVFHSWIKNPKAMVQTVAGSVGLWSLGGIVVFSLVAACGRGETWAYACSIYPLAILAGLVPLTVSGIGTRDSAFVALLSVHIPLEEATLVGIGYTVFAYWFLCLVSLPIVGWEIVAYIRSRSDEEAATDGDRE
jgi:uncharacterized membrane protein YbhN (UPF0104 family)